MKKQKNIVIMAQGRNFTDFSEKLFGRIRNAKPEECNHAILPFNHSIKRSGDRLYNGPPGRSRSPGIGLFFLQDHPPESGSGKGNILTNEYQYFNENNESKFYNNLNFNIMKKQILFLVFLVLAGFANVNRSYGACDEDALHPIANKGYDYSVTVVGWTDVTYQWFVTDNPAILTGGALGTNITPSATTFAVSGAPYNSTTNTTATINITWAAELIASTFATPTPSIYYVVVKYIGTDASGCSASNIKAYRIRPVNSFQLDLVNVNSSGADIASPFVNCISDLVDMTIVENANPVIDPTVTYNYGVNVVYEKVTVRNFKGNWTMNINYTELNNNAIANGETFTMSYGTSIATSDANPITVDNVTVDEQTPGIASDDETIYLKLTYTHGTNENLAVGDYTITVNGTDAGGNPDVSEVDCSTSLVDDQVVQTISNRPTVTNNTVPSPQDFIQQP